jgi:RNA polymerase-binding transcription factor DksA
MNHSEKIDPRWTWHFETLLALRAQLIRVRDEHRSDTATSVESGGADPVDHANDQAEREVILAELNAEEAELTAIDAALERLRAGTYGICAKTGKPISADRLRAVPWTPFSRETAGRLEQGAARK